MAIGTPTSLGTVFEVSSGGSDTIVLTIGATGASVGDLVLVVAGDDGSVAAGGPSTCADSKGNTYTRDVGPVNDLDDYTGAIFSAVLTTALVNGDTITVTFTNRNGTWDNFIGAYKVTGSWNSSRVDKIASAEAGVAGTAWDSGLTATTTVADELVFGLGVVGGAATSASFSPGTNLTELHGVDNLSEFIDWTSVYRIVSATGQYKANGTYTDSDLWGGLVVTYKEAGGTTLSPASITHTRAQGSPRVDPKPAPASIVHTRAQGSPAVSPTVTAASIVHTRAQGDPTISTATAVSPASIEHTRAQGSPTVSPQVVPASIAHTRALGDPVVSTAGTVGAASIEHTRAQGSPQVNTQVLPASVAHTRAMGDLVVQNSLDVGTTQTRRSTGYGL